jgi:DNA-binding CsgD family transcriptional regulator
LRRESPIWANFTRAGEDQGVPAARPPVWVIPPDDRLLPERNGVFDAWTEREGFELPASPWDLSMRRWVCTGVISDQRAAATAMEALARGVGLRIIVQLTGDDRRRFEEDLARTGTPVADRREGTVGLTAVQIALLDALAAGLSVTAAAAQTNLSRRSANRRLAEARDRLGVSSTAEAVTGWAGRTDPGGQSPP